MSTITTCLWFDGKAEEAAMKAMLGMTKLDIASLEKAGQ